MITLAIANAKGGVGKTSTAVHLATGLARQGEKTLLVDLDSQGNSTLWLTGTAPKQGAADILLKEGPPDQEIQPVPDRKDLFLAAATPKLGVLDVGLAQMADWELSLKRALAQVADRFDYVILDCPPNLGPVVISAFCASDAVLVPILPAYLSLAGLRRLEETLERLKKHLAIKTSILGYVLFAADRRIGFTNEARKLLAQIAGPKLYDAEIRVSTAATGLPAHKKVAWDRGADARGSYDYRTVLKETTQRLERLMAAQG